MKESLLYPVIHRPLKQEIYIPAFEKTVLYNNPDDDIIKIAQEVLGELLKNDPKKPSENYLNSNNEERLIYIHIWVPYHVNKEEKSKKHLTIKNSINVEALHYNINFSKSLTEKLEKILLAGGNEG